MYSYLGFQGGDSLCFFQIGLLCSVEGTDASLLRQPSMLEDTASSTWSPWEDRVSF
jgi:hypothetical protein